jgi:ribosomal protein L19
MTLLPVLLPEGYVAKVSANEKIAVGTVLAEKKSGAREKVIHISSVFNLPPKDIQKVLKKHLGDGVVKGDTIAEKKGSLGVGSKRIISEFSGTIIRIDEENGDLIVRESGEETSVETLISPVDGIVDSCDNEKIVIKTDKNAILAEDGLGKEKEGELLYLEDAQEERLGKEIEEKVILTKLIDRVAIFKAIGLDANGIITEDLENVDFVDLTGKAIETPIMIVNGENFKKLVKANGKKVYLGGKDKSIVIL